MNLQPAPVQRTSYPARTDGRVRVYVDGVESFERIGAAALAAKERIWVTVSFVDLQIRLPGIDMTLIELADSAAARGVDVRLLFWWSEFPGIGSFRGDEDEIAELGRRGSRVKMRWDHIQRGCHHQKSWFIDDGPAFVGGINITDEALSTPAHVGAGFHDLFAGIEGAAALDVGRNFVDRWNQATVTRDRAHAFPSIEHADDLPEIRETRCSTSGGSPQAAQIVRTIGPQLYAGRRGWHVHAPVSLDAGEHGIRDTLHEWIKAARHSIYIENQFLIDPPAIRLLCEAARRGVEIIALLPGEPDPNLLLYPEDDMAQTRAELEKLGRLSTIGLFSLAHETEPATPIYVHSKLLIVDDRLIMVGSANIWPPSLSTDTELNVACWDRELASHTRDRLWAEHLLGTQASGLADWQRLAREASQERRDGRPAAVRIVALDPARYYEFSRDTDAPWREVDESS